MSTNDPREQVTRLEEERDALQKSLDTAYAQLSEVTSRVLAMSEASDSFVETHDTAGVAQVLLRVAAQAAGARLGGLFLAYGEGAFDLVSSIGVDEEESALFGQSLPDLAICQLVQNEGRPFDLAAAREHEAFREWQAEAQAEDPAAEVAPRMELFVPIQLDERLLAVLALGPPAHADGYGEDERLFLEHVATQGALALDRAMLFESNEDRLRDLDALLKISQELSSTLDLDHVLLTAVNLTGAIIPRQRAVLAMFEGGKLKIRAISDFPRVDASTIERLGLGRLIEYLGYRKADSLVVRASELAEDADGADVWGEYFAGEMRAAYATLLKDDQGPVGVLLLEAYDERAFDRDSDREAIGVLVGQLSVAIRNAELYRQLPMVSALAPLAARRRAWMRMTSTRRRNLLIAAAVVFLLVAVVPWPAAVGGNGQVLPATEVAVRAGVAGQLQQLAARAGERVHAGQPLAVIQPAAVGPRLAGLRAEADRALYAGASAGEQNDNFGRRMAEIDREKALAGLAAAERDDERGRVVAPVDGFVLTPDLAEREGAWVEAGDVICQVSALDTLRVELGVAETEVARVRPGQTLRLKVLAFPDRQFRGRVSEVAWQGEPSRPGHPAVFKVIGWVENPGPRLRSGMTGRARVDVGRDTILARATRGIWRWLRLGFWV